MENGYGLKDGKSRFPVLKDLEVPNLTLDKEDKVVWLTNTNQFYGSIWCGSSSLFQGVVSFYG
jgi:hypothetical protein